MYHYVSIYINIYIYCGEIHDYPIISLPLHLALIFQSCVIPVSSSYWTTVARALQRLRSADKGSSHHKSSSDLQRLDQWSVKQHRWIYRMEKHADKDTHVMHMTHTHIYIYIISINQEYNIYIYTYIYIHICISYKCSLNDANKALHNIANHFAFHEDAFQYRPHQKCVKVWVKQSHSPMDRWN